MCKGFSPKQVGVGPDIQLIIDHFDLIMKVPAKPNYNLVMYYGAERPVNKDSLLGRFIDETDAFRGSRFKLIPSIVEVYSGVSYYHACDNLYM
jgi:hypothetical protein